jgi:hypothetical protein
MLYEVVDGHRVGVTLLPFRHAGILFLPNWHHRATSWAPTVVVTAPIRRLP